MANNFDDILGGAGQKPAPTGPRPLGREIGGTFSCQHCEEVVAEAEYFPTESLLVWECTEKHRSFLEGFDLM